MKKRFQHGSWIIALGMAVAFPAHAGPFLGFGRFASLTRDQQARYLQAVREFLAESDLEAAHQARGWGSVLLDRFICPAYADDPGFCINLGFVRPQDQCEPGQNWHNFQTRDVLKDYKLEALDKCKAGQKACSPFFGVQADGTLYCNSRNSTPACDQASPRDDASFLDALDDCAKKGRSGETGFGKEAKITVSCGDVIRFFEDQTKQIAASCAQSTKACRFVRERLSRIVDQAPEDTKKAVGFLNDAIVKALRGGAPAAAPCDGGAAALACKAEDLSKDARAAEERVEGLLLEEMDNDGGGTSCGSVKLPGGRTLAAEEDGLSLSGPPARGSKDGAEKVELQASDELGLFQLMRDLRTEKKFKIAAADVMRYSLPAGPIEDNEKLRANGKEYAARKWTTANGTVVKCAVGLADDAPGGHPVLYLTIRLQGRGPERLIRVGGIAGRPAAPGEAPAKPASLPEIEST